MAQPVNEPEDQIKFTNEEITRLEQMQGCLAETYDLAVKHYDANEAHEDGDMSYPTRAAQRTAIATSASAWLDVTKSLRKIKPAP